MPNEFFGMGIGPQGLHLGLTLTVQSPSDTNTTTKAITADAPMRWARTGNNAGLTSGGVLCAADEIPEMFATARVDIPGQPVGVRCCKPSMLAGDAGTGQYVAKLPYSGAPVANGNMGIVADGAGKVKLVLAADGVGRVVDWAGGWCHVLL